MGQQGLRIICHISPVVNVPLTTAIGETNRALHARRTMTKATCSLIRQDVEINR